MIIRAASGNGGLREDGDRSLRIVMCIRSAIGTASSYQLLIGIRYCSHFLTSRLIFSDVARSHDFELPDRSRGVDSWCNHRLLIGSDLGANTKSVLNSPASGASIPNVIDGGYRPNHPLLLHLLMDLRIQDRPMSLPDQQDGRVMAVSS